MPAAACRLIEHRYADAFRRRCSGAKDKTMKLPHRLPGIILLTLLAGMAQAQVSHEKHIQPVWERNCSECHGEQSPSQAQYAADPDRYTQLGVGPRMGSREEMLQFVVWPDAGALMRALDEGVQAHASEGGKRLGRKARRAAQETREPGSMYQYLGADEAERQRNLTLFKAWVGHDAWHLKPWDEWTKEELDLIQARP